MSAQRNGQRPLELILARNLLSSLSTPAFLVGEQGALVYYNEAAGALLGRAFEEIGMLSAPEWTGRFGPFDEQGNPIAYDEIAATIALRSNRPYHGSFCIRSSDGSNQEVAASAIPIVGPSGSSGAIVIFWPLNREDSERDVVVEGAPAREDVVVEVAPGVQDVVVEETA